MNTLSKGILTLALLCGCHMAVCAQAAQESEKQAEAAASELALPAGSKVYVAPMEGFETYLIAALDKKKVPLVVVTKKEEADFEISGNSEAQKAGWAKTIFGSGLPAVAASIQIVNLKTGRIVFAVSESRRDAAFGKRSVAEYLAKKIGEKMRNEEKK